MQRMLSILFLASALSACSLLPAPPSSGHAVRIQGLLQPLANGWQLQPCDPGQDSMVLATTLQQDEQFKASCAEIYESSCFADLLISSGSPTTVSGLLRLEPEGAGCAASAPAGSLLQASGNEPFWSVLITRQGLMLSSPTQPPLALPHIEEALPDGSLYYSSQADHQLLQIWLTPGHCIDSMSGAYRHLNARLEWQGQILSGCAYYATDNPATPPVITP